MDFDNRYLSEIGNIYPKPIKFSDSHYEYGTALLSSILSKSTKELNGVDYGIIFNTNLPPGTFQEVAYFIPSSFYYLGKSPDDFGEMLDNWISFFYLHQEKFKKENVFFIIEQCLLDLLINLTSNFKVIEFNKIECQKKGWGLDYFFYIENSAIICELVELLSKHHITLPVFDFFDTLKEDDINKNLKWLLEINDQISHILMYLDIEIPTDILLNNLFEMGFDGGKNPLYWNRIFDRL